MSEPDGKLVLCRGRSSWPLLRDKSMLSIVPVPLDAVRIGDIVVFRSKDLAICHRVIGQRTRESRREILTKGDARLASDGWIAADRVEGRVAAVNGWTTRSYSFRAASCAMLAVSWLVFAAYRTIFRPLRVVAKSMRKPS